MGFVISLILIAFGAILTWAVQSTSGSVDVNVVGVIRTTTYVEDEPPPGP